MTHHRAHVGHGEVRVEAPPVDRTHILLSSEGGDGDGSSNGQNWQVVREAPVDAFLVKREQSSGLRGPKKGSGVPESGASVRKDLKVDG